MARLNTRLSATPQQQQTRSSTVDTLYRDPSVAPRYARTARASASYSVMSPAGSQNSDKENERLTRENTPQSIKRKATQGRGPAPRMPTPDSGSAAGGNSNKRRRTGDYDRFTPVIFEDESADGIENENDEDDDDDEENVERQEVPEQGQAEAEDEEPNLRFYNPNQDPNQRRRLRASMRDHQRMVDDHRDEIVKPNSMLLDALKTQNNLFGKVRQTADAAIDSRFLVNASELAGKKLNNSLQGNAGVGIDLDQFVSKCIYFMKSGGYVAGEEDAPALQMGDDEDDNADGLNWAILGRQACFPSNKRPPTTSFLLGPLSIQKKVRTTQRKARSQRQPVGPATRPQEIREGDIQQSENSNLSNLVKGIRSQLQKHLERGIAGIEDELSQIDEDDMDEESQYAAFRRFRMAQAPETEEAAVGLLDFAINPHDFGQTVENLFYISFLVREGNAKVIKDEDGLPLLVPAEPHGVSDQREKNVQKHQAVFSIDYPTWQMFIEAFDIKEPLIPHREQEEANVGSGGWYAG